MTSARRIQIGAALGAAALIGLSAMLPLWTMKMEAPQYRKGLFLHAYGTGMTGDLHELNILNHYIGMPAVEAPTFETAIFPAGIAVLVVLCLLSPLHRWLRRAAIAGALLTPLGIIADLQYRLYVFGHSLNPTAPIRLKPFTPLVIGETHMGNFESHAMVSWGFFCFVAAAFLLVLAGLYANRFARTRRVLAVRATPAAAMIAAFILSPVAPAEAQPGALQAQTRRGHAGDDGADRERRPPGSDRHPWTAVGNRRARRRHRRAAGRQRRHHPGDGVTFRGFTVRNSGRQVTEEAAGIKVTGNRHRIESNTITQVYFGIHIGAGTGSVVQDNIITPGQSHGARPGHGISAWNLKDAQLLRNRISDARDGIYLSFTEHILVASNVITGCRYGLHSMYSQDARFENNEATGNLLGAALMMSDRLALRGNRIQQHREGTAAYGILLKDIGDLVAEDNHVLANRVGIYAEAVPSNPSRQAIFARNVIAGNEVGLALQSNAALTMTGNRIADNLTDVRPLGKQLSADMRWSQDGRGNSWGQYRGFDADRDGIGDVPYALHDAMDALVRRNPLIQAFLYTPAHLAIEAAARMFPLYRQAPLLVDSHPLMAVPARRTR